MSMSVVMVGYSTLFLVFYAIWGKNGPPISAITVFGAWMFVNIADAHSTYLFTKKLGVNKEGNPLIHWLFKKIGVLPSLFIKLAVAVMIGLLVLIEKNEIKLAILACTVVLAFVSIINYKVARD